jgi:hypothetical protein
MANVETALTFPLTIPTGQLSTQQALGSPTNALQLLFQEGLVTVAEYIINEESSTDTDWDDRANAAQQIVINPIFFAMALGPLIAADPVTINGSSTDQQIVNRIWTIWHVLSYDAVAVMTARGALAAP